MSEPAVETTAAAALGDEIRDRRKRHGWTQRELAARLGHGVRREYVARWEGGAPVTSPFWEPLEDVLRIRVDPALPGGWVDADEDDAARAAAGGTVVNVVVVVGTAAEAAAFLRDLRHGATVVPAADVLRSLTRVP